MTWVALSEPAGRQNRGERLECGRKCTLGQECAGSLTYKSAHVEARQGGGEGIVEGEVNMLNPRR
jgi:hypothetical protein